MKISSIHLIIILILFISLLALNESVVRRMAGEMARQNCELAFTADVFMLIQFSILFNRLKG